MLFCTPLRGIEGVAHCDSRSQAGALHTDQDSVCKYLKSVSHELFENCCRQWLLASKWKGVKGHLWSGVIFCTWSLCVLYLFIHRQVFGRFADPISKNHHLAMRAPLWFKPWAVSALLIVWSDNSWTCIKETFEYYKQIKTISQNKPLQPNVLLAKILEMITRYWSHRMCFVLWI